MSSYVSVNVKCPCGRILLTRNCNAEGKSVTTGTKRCPACKKEVAYKIVGAEPSAGYKA